MPFDQVFFSPPEGDNHSPDEYIQQLADTEKTKTAILLTFLKENNPVNWPKSVHTIEEFRQIRIGDHRIMFYILGKFLIVVNAFRKTTRKTPKEEIKRARLNLELYYKSTKTGAQR